MRCDAETVAEKNEKGTQMASYSWTVGASGDWTTAANWSTGSAPDDPTANVTIDAPALPGGSYTVTIAPGESETVATLTMNAVNNFLGTTTPPYRGAILQLEGTLTFAPGSIGGFDGSYQTILDTPAGSNSTLVNAGVIEANVTAEGNMLLTGTNGVYITNGMLADGGTITIDTSSIAEMTGATLFDGVFDAQGPGSAYNFGGPRENLVVGITAIEGPPTIPDGWTGLIFNDPSAQINEWNGTTYVPVETTLIHIGAAGTLEVLAGRNYTTANTLTIDAGVAGGASGLIYLQGGTISTAGIDINGGIVQGSATIVGGVVNNGTLIAVDGTLDLTGGLTGTGTVKFDLFENVTTPVLDPVGGTLIVNGVSAGQTFVMNGDDVLVLNAPGAFAGKIQAGIGDKIVLQGVTATSAIDTNGTLVVSNGSVTVASLGLTGSYTTDHFEASGSTISLVTGAPAIIPTPTGSHFAVADTTTNTVTTSDGDAYTGPVAGLQWQFITTTTDSLAITATAPNSFIHTGSGEDAIDVSHVGGTNVLDGSTGSNFLVGGTGSDTFFVDDRGPSSDIWSTVSNFHSGDAATIWGVTQGGFNLSWVDEQGATGFTGLTLHATSAAAPTASLTLAGFTSADLADGKLTVSFGTTQASGGVPGSSYMYVHAT
jgi:hypothetical protein